MQCLKEKLLTRFPFIVAVDANQDLNLFDIHLDPSVQHTAPLVRELYTYFESYLQIYGNTKEGYLFTIYQGGQVIDGLSFNLPDHQYHITIDIDGKIEQLRIVDVMGATGEYSVYNSDFERLGTISTDTFPLFTPGDHWTTDNLGLKPHLNTIITRIGEQIQMEEEKFEIDVNDPDDVAFWAEQFQIEIKELQKAIRVVGANVEQITAYLQK